MYKYRKKLPLLLVLGAGVVFTYTIASGGRCGELCLHPAQSDPVELSDEQVAAQKTAVLAAAGRAAVSYMAAAQQGIDATDTESARRYLEVARGMLGQMQEAVSVAGGNASDMVPIFARVGVSHDTDLTDEVKAQLVGLETDVRKGDHRKVIETLEATGIGAAYTYVDLPLAGTIAQVDAALAALDGGGADEASQAITAANEGLVTDTLIVGMTDISAQEESAANS